MNDQPTAGAPTPRAHADRRDAFARLIYEHWNPDTRWEDAHPHDRITYRADAEVAIKAADATAGTPYSPPVRADVYQEVADRLSLYTELDRVKKAGVTAIPDAVRDWGTRLEDKELRRLADEATPVAVPRAAPNGTSAAVAASAEQHAVHQTDALPAGFRSAVVIAVECAVCEYQFDEDQSYTVHFDTLDEAHQVLRDHGWTVLADGRVVCDSDEDDHHELRGTTSPAKAREESDREHHQAEINAAINYALNELP